MTKTLEDVEREHILLVYQEKNFVKADTALALGVTVKTLYNKFAKYVKDSRVPVALRERLAVRRAKARGSK